MTLVAMPAEGCGAFEFDLATPLFVQIHDALESVAFVSADGLAHVERRPGVYALRHRGSIVYAGKSDDSVRSRLEKHYGQLRGRIGISPEEVEFKCLYFAETWDPFKPEDFLVEKYGATWNGTGFGPNDPGRERDTTKLKDDHWHVRYPLDPRFPVDIPPGDYSAIRLLQKVKEEVPFWFRYQSDHAARKVYEEADQVTVDKGPAATVDTILQVVRGLPDARSWQLTLRPSHILLYKERREYSRMRILWPTS